MGKKIKKSKPKQNNSKKHHIKNKNKANGKPGFKSEFKKNINKTSSQKKLKKILTKTVGKVSSSSIDLNKKHEHDPDEMERTLFVGNIPSNTKKSQLKSIFEPFGPVKSIRFRTLDGKKILKHKTRKESETLNAYIVMNSKENAENAIKLSGTEFKGKHIRVTKAEQSSEDVDAKRIVFVGNLKYSATDEKLYEIFSSCGELEYVRTIRNANGCKGIAYVCFKKPESITLALELNNTLLDERPIRVERYSTRKLEEYQKKKLNNTQDVKPNRKELTNKSDKNFDNVKSSKKSKYHGVQITKMKKQKKKKITSSMKILAKKVAPKTPTNK